MKVVVNMSEGLKDSNPEYFRLEELSNESNESVIFVGYNTTHNKELQNPYKFYKRKILFNYWMPTEFGQFSDCRGIRPIDQDEFFNEIYSICPYTTNWLNKIKNTSKYKNFCYPFNLRDIPKEQKKVWDVCYHGSILSNIWHKKAIEIMSKFNYKFIHIHSNPGFIDNYATDINLTHTQKLLVIAKTKISICYNFCPVHEQNEMAYKSHVKWQENKIFRNIDKYKLIPQMKSRFQEAAFCRTLNLVRKDPYNVVENYYIANKHFIYFDNEDELENKINDILNNWDKYKIIIDNAYKKCQEYSIDKIFNKIKNEK